MVKADENLKKGSVADKYIILISADKVTYNKTELDIIKDSNYNVLSLCLNNTTNELKQLHNDLGVDVTRYFESNRSNGSDLSTIMTNMAEIIASPAYMPYEFDVKLKLNLKDNFEAVSGFESQEDDVITIPVTVKYNHTGNGNYVAQPVPPVSFVVKPKVDRYGILTFGSDSSINYISLIHEKIEKTIQTAKIKVDSHVLELKHGIDKGISGDSYFIKENQGQVVKDTYITLAGAITVEAGNINSVLRINKIVDVNSEDTIKAYIFKDGKLETVQYKVTMAGENGVENIYNIDFMEEFDSTTQIIIKYQCRAPKDLVVTTFDNYLKCNDREKQFIISVVSGPDLF